MGMGAAPKDARLGVSAGTPSLGTPWCVWLPVFLWVRFPCAVARRMSQLLPRPFWGMGRSCSCSSGLETREPLRGTLCRSLSWGAGMGAATGFPVGPVPLHGVQVPVR
jgi:hypothetical protein